jgi:O-antigen biosynthesis protein WbqP
MPKHAADGCSRKMIKRAVDFTLAILLLGLLACPLVVIGILIKCTSRGPILYWSDRVGRNNRIFRMPKFRTMRIGTPEVATHLLTKPAAYLTPVGGLFRRSSLDELPQLFSIIAGDLSFVGPRPALFNQHDLTALRTERGVETLVPGLTGWAQVNGRDELAIPKKVHFDYEYLQRQSFKFDFQIMMLTIIKVIRREGIRH